MKIDKLSNILNNRHWHPMWSATVGSYPLSQCRWWRKSPGYGIYVETTHGRREQLLAVETCSASPLSSTRYIQLQLRWQNYFVHCCIRRHEMMSCVPEIDQVPHYSIPLQLLILQECARWMSITLNTSSWPGNKRRWSFAILLSLILLNFLKISHYFSQLTQYSNDFSSFFVRNIVLWLRSYSYSIGSCLDGSWRIDVMFFVARISLGISKCLYYPSSHLTYKVFVNDTYGVNLLREPTNIFKSISIALLPIFYFVSPIMNQYFIYGRNWNWHTKTFC